MKKSSVLGGLAFAAILGSVFTFPVYAKEKTFPEGIYAGGFALGGLTKEQAETQFAAYISGLEERSVTLDVAGNGLETTAKDLGYACKNEDALQEAEEYAQAAVWSGSTWSARIWKRSRCIFRWMQV